MPCEIRHLAVERARRAEAAAAVAAPPVRRFHRPPLVLQAEPGSGRVRFTVPGHTFEQSVDEALGLAADIIRLARTAKGDR